MWEFVTQLLWLPFDIMQRISQRFIHLGRTVYGVLLGPASKPAIKSPPPGTSPLSTSPSPLPLQPRASSLSSSSSVFPDSLPTTPSHLPPSPASSSSSTSISMTSPSTTVVIDMEPSIVETDKDNAAANRLTAVVLSAVSTSTTAPPKYSSSSLSEEATTSVLNPDQDNYDLELTSAITTKTLASGDAVAATADVSLALAQSLLPLVDADEANGVVVVKSAARGGGDYDNKKGICAMSNNADVDAATKRFREKEKRRQVAQPKFIDASSENSASISTSDVHSHQDDQQQSQAKKPKLSVEPSTSSGAEATEKAKRKKKRSKKNKKVDVPAGESGEGDKMGILARPPPPNFFIAVQISNKDIISSVAQLQKSLSEVDLNPSWHGLTNTEIFKDAMVPVAKLHFTLHVMHLKGEDDLQKAQSVLAECCSEVHQEFVDNPMDLTIEGLGHFKNNVIFAQIKEKSNIERLTKLAELFRAKFNELNIPVDPRPFNPHMTIAKISRSNKLYKRKIRSFPPDLMWSGCGPTSFGVQRVTGVQLLQMAGEDKATGYYQCLGQYYFEDPLLITPLPPANSQDKLKGDDSI